MRELVWHFRNKLLSSFLRQRGAHIEPTLSRELSMTVVETQPEADANDTRWKFRLVFDPQRQGLCTQKMTLRQSHRGSDWIESSSIVVEQAKEIAPGIWLPTSVTLELRRMSGDPKKGEVELRQKVIADKWIVNGALDPKLFTLEFEPGVNVFTLKSTTSDLLLQNRPASRSAPRGRP